MIDRLIEIIRQHNQAQSSERREVSAALESFIQCGHGYLTHYKVDRQDNAHRST